MLSFSWGWIPILANHGCIVQVFFGGLTHLDLVIPRGAQALHASELFTKFWGPGASHSLHLPSRTGYLGAPTPITVMECFDERHAFDKRQTHALILAGRRHAVDCANQNS